MLPPLPDPAWRAYGFLRPSLPLVSKREVVPVSGRQELLRSLAANRKIRWAAVPDSSFLIPVELLDPRHSTVDLSSYRKAVLAAMKRPLRLLVLHVALFFVLKSPIFLILALMFGLFPLLDLALDLRRRPDRMSVEEINEERVDEALFFLSTKQAGRPWIGIAIAVLAAIYCLQVVTGFERSIDVAALVKPRVWMGEWWRLLTVALLHGHPLHIFFNGFALFHLSRLIATLAPVRLLLPLFLLSLLTGSLASLLLMPNADSVGASGGIMGLLGFLTVHGFRFRGFLPPGVGSGVLRSAGAMIILGIIGAGLIDNAAHAGGFAGGVIFALVFYRRRRPENTFLSQLGNATCRASGTILVTAALYVIGVLLGLIPG